MGGMLCATGHMAEPELSGTGSGSGAVGTHGGTGALSCRLRSLAPWGWSFKFCAQGTQSAGYQQAQHLTSNPQNSHYMQESNDSTFLMKHHKIRLKKQHHQ
jgi:hypothetical protein